MNTLDPIEKCAKPLFDNEVRALQRATNRTFAYLLVGQWAFAIFCAVTISPLTWTGPESQTHAHVWAALVLGGVLVSLPLWLMWKAPDTLSTRLVVSSAQLLFSSLLIHLMGGRIEAHFHVFGSLALLAFYRDPWVFVPAVALTFVDHVVRGLLWPESVFGVLTPSVLRAFEHAGWVLFETTFLLWGVAQSRAHLYKSALLQASLTSERDALDQRVQQRTQEIEAGRDYLQNILNSLDTHLCILDRDGEILSTNDAWQRFGVERRGVSGCGTGDNYLEVCDNSKGAGADVAVEVATGIRDVIAGRICTYLREYESHGPSEKRWFQARVLPFRGADNAAVVVCHTDITKRVLATAASMEESRRASSLAQIIRESPNEVYIFNQEDLRFEEINNGACLATGYSREELLGMSPPDLTPDLDDRAYQESIRQLVDNRIEVLDFQTKHRRKNGKLYPVQVSLHKATYNDLPVFVASVTDLTEVHSLEQRLSQAQKLESLGQLAAGIAHEINTPMQCIASNVEFLSESYHKINEALVELQEGVNGPPEPWTSRKEKTLQLIQNPRLELALKQTPSAIEDAGMASKRVIEIVRAMKSMAHPGTTHKSHVDLNEVIRNATTITRNRWKDACEVRHELDASLPTIWGHVEALNQVLLNLIVNAADAISERATTSPGSIVIRTSGDGSSVSLEVEDNGIGMSEEVRKRVFDPFFTTKEVGKGTGQGLSITHDIVVSRHGGAIDVQSTEGAGTCFRVTLPMSEPDEQTSDNSSGAANTEKEQVAL